MSRWEKQEARLLKHLSQNVRDLRNERNLTIEGVAHTAELNWRHWQKIEAGEVSITIRTAARIAAALGVEPGELLRKPVL